MKRLYEKFNSKDTKEDSFFVAKIKRESRRWNLKSWKEYENYLLEEKITNQYLWEIYLKKLESPLREESIKYQEYDLSKEEIKYEERPSYWKYMSDLPMALGILSDRESQVIKCMFWYEKSKQCLGKEILIKKAMKKIKDCLLAIEDVSSKEKIIF